MYIILRVINPQTFDAAYEVYGLSSLSSLFRWLTIPDKSAKVKDLSTENVNLYAAYTQSNRIMKLGILQIFHLFFTGIEESGRVFLLSAL